MRKYINKNKLQNNELSIISKFSFFKIVPFYNIFSNLKNIMLSSFLHTNEGALFVLKTNKSLAFKDLLFKFKSKEFIESFTIGASFNDYPKTLKVFIRFYLDKDNLDIKHYSSSRVSFEDGYDLAISKAFGEAMERHSSCYNEWNKKTYYPKVKNIDASFLYKLIPKFTKIQIKNNPQFFSNEDDLKEIKGFKVRSLISGRSKLLPFNCFYWGDTIDVKQKIFLHQTTSGCGGGLTYRQALLSSLYENIERDHFFLYWLSGINPNIIKNETIGGDFGVYIKEVKEKYNLDVYFLDLRYDTKVPVCICVIIDPVLNLIAIGGKACSSSIETLKLSFVESMSILSSIRESVSISEETLKDVLKQKPFLENINREKRLSLYNSRFGIERIKKSFLSGRFINFDDYDSSLKLFKDTKEELNYLIDIFKDLKKEKGDGYDAYIHEFDSLWLSEMNYYSVKVFVPSFLKLYLNENLATPISDRLVEFAKGKGKIINKEEDINPLPHFFP